MKHRRALHNFMVIGITNRTNRDLVYGGKREKSVFKQQWAGHQLADSQHSGCKVLSHFREGLQKTSSPPPLGGQGPLPVLTVPLLSTFTNSIPTACCILYLPLESLAKARILSHSCSMHQLFPLVRADRASLPNSPWSDFTWVIWNRTQSICITKISKCYKPHCPHFLTQNCLLNICQHTPVHTPKGKTYVFYRIVFTKRILDEEMTM